MVNHHRAAIFAALLLIIAGAACVGLRVKCMHKPPLSQGGNVWRLTYDVEFHANNSSARLYIALPSDTAYANIVNETFSHKRLAVDILQNKETWDREAIAVASECSRPSKFTAQFDVSISTDAKRSVYSSKKPLGTPEKLRYLRNEKFIQKDDPNVVRVLTSISDSKKTKAKLIESIFDYCSESLAQSQSDGPTDAATVLQQGQCGALGRARAMAALCRAGRIPSRLVTGFILENSPRAKPFTWVEIYHKKKWIPYDPHNEFSLQLPANYLPMKHGGIRIVKNSEGSKCFFTYSIERLEKTPFMTVSSNIMFWNIFDLTRLPISMKKTLALILLLPTGALITAFFRNLIGIQTFGTFTPTLLALSLVNSDWKTGAIIFLLILGIGLLCRTTLNWLKLLAVPRLGIILTVVVMCLIVAVSVCEYFGFAPTARSILLPVVIMTMMIERFFITLEEDGGKEALKVLCGTVVVATCCFTLLRSALIGQVVLTFPEMQLFIAAVFVLIGRYSGYRLSELWRFRDIVKLQG
ncbi:MAG: 7TM domain-containing protein [Planctomycetota bacterium]|jgi:hypothetical protein